MNNLLIALKDKLNITWLEEETERKLERILESAKSALDRKLGADIDYTKPSQEQELFLNYCMYSWNNCLNEFDNNYLNEIMQIRQYYEVINYDETE